MAQQGPPDAVIHVAAGGYRASSGEVFPIMVADGVQLIGPGRGTARVESDAQQEMFVVDGLPSPTLIANMFLDNSHGSGPNPMFRLQGYPADFTLLKNTLRLES